MRSSTGALLLRLAPFITVGAFLLPIAAGLAATLLPALGYHPPLGSRQLGLEQFRAFFAMPGIQTSLLLTLRAGFLATFLAFALAMGLSACWYHTRLYQRLQGLLAPLLATPHSAMAIGCAFLLAPSGWVLRLLAGPLGLSRPPNLITVQDEWGLSLVFALLLKVTPFLLLMTGAALNQVDPRSSLAVARSMGYGPAWAWLKTVFPRVYPQLRLPLYAVLAFSLSVVDVALIMAPSTPPPLSVYVLRLFNHKELAMQMPGAAGAVTLFCLVLLAIGAWRLLEMAAARAGRNWLSSGGRGRRQWPLCLPCALGAGVLGIAAAGSVAVLGLWSCARVWRFPAALPQQFSLETWQRHLETASAPAWTTLTAGVAAVAAALCLALACLENEDRHGVGSGRGLVLLYIPLLVPQIAFLFGAQIVFIRLDLAGTWAGLVWSHLLFVLPYVFLSLADPWRSLDERYRRTAASLGASPWKTFARVKLPLLLRPLCVAAAVGFAVSAGEYLPTLFAGAGRFATLTTEAVTLAAGGDRRVAAVYGVLQTLLPLAVFLAAMLLPALLHRRREGMRH